MGRYRRARTVVSSNQARTIALALTDALEADHHGRPSFRIGGKIFATLWDDAHMNVMLDEPGVVSAVQAHPRACRELWWGGRLRGVQVTLADVDAALLAELLEDAWEQKASTRRAPHGSPRR